LPFDDQSFRTVAVELFGGLVAEENPADIPEGASPLCNDVEFEPGSVFQRRGLSPVYAALAGNPTIQYVRSFKEQDNQGEFTLLLDSLGNLWREDIIGAPGVLSNVTANIVPGSYAFSTTYLGREYIAFHNGNFGIDIPRQYDATNLDRVSQVGPGAAPAVGDDSTAWAINGAANAVGQFGAAVALTNIAQVGNLVIVTPSSTANFARINNESIVIAGVAPAAFNGTFNVTWINGNTQFQYSINTSSNLGAGTGGTAQSQAAFLNFLLPLPAQLNTGFLSAYQAIFPAGLTITTAGIGVAGYNGTWKILGISFWQPSAGHFQLQLIVNIASVSLANSFGGTLNVNGNIGVGVHKVVVYFLTRQGYLTAPSPVATWTAAGSKRAVITNIPTGPPNIIARVLAFTAAGGGNYFTVGPSAIIPGVVPIIGSSMTINDNTTTTAYVDFSDTLLLASTPIDQPGNNLFALVELGESLGVIQYALRTAWWGERNKLENVINFTFDGGFGPVGSAPTYPLGWNVDPTNGSGGGSAVALGLPVVWGDAYVITGNGNGIVGLISQSVYQDSNGIPIVPINTPISIRVRVARNGTLVTGTLHLALFSASLGGAVVGPTLSIPASSLTTKYQEFALQLTTGLTTVPYDLVLEIYADGTPTTGGSFLIDNVEPFPTTVPFNDSQIRLSYVQNSESFDGTTGVIQVSPGDGQQIRSCFILRNILYIAKDRSLYATQDNGSTEPSGWTVSEISATVGTCSVNGISYPKGTEEGGEDWAVIANKKGLYLFNGGEPMKMSQEVQNDLSVASTAPWDTINWAASNTIWCVNDSRARQIFVGAPTGANVTPSTLLMLDYKELNTSYAVGSEGPIHTSYSGRVISWEPGRKWALWSMSINAAAMIDRPNGQSVLFLGNNVGNGKVYQLLKTSFTDDGALIPSTYTTYAMPSREQERDLQLWSNRKFYKLLTMYLEGSGNIVINTFPLTLTNPGPSYIITPVAHPVGDYECPLHVAGERCHFQIQSNFAGNWWRLRTFAVRMRPHAVARIRQSNAV
jgi:hypothetical protein